MILSVVGYKSMKRVNESATKALLVILYGIKYLAVIV